MEQKNTTLAILLVVGLVIGAAAGYMLAPKGSEDTIYVDVPVEVPVEVHPLAGKTIQIGDLASSTKALTEFRQTVIMDIASPDIHEYLDKTGLDIQIEYLQDFCGEVDIALQKIQSYHALGVDLIQGPGWSSAIQGSIQYMTENEILMISTGSSTPLLSIKDDMLFRTTPNDFASAPAVVELWNTWGVKGVVIMYVADTWGDGLFNLISPGLDDVGIEELGNIRYSPETTDYSSFIDQMNTIVTNAADDYGNFEDVGILVIMTDEVVPVLHQASDYPNLMKTLWMGVESSGRKQRVLDDAGDLGVTVKLFGSVMGLEETMVYKEFAEKYTAETGLIPDIYRASLYDSAWLMLNSLLSTGSLEPTEVQEVVISNAERQFGVSGWMALDETGDRLPQIMDIWGYYIDPDTGENSFRTFGFYDGSTGIAEWDDAALLEYHGLVRPALSP